MSVADDEDEQQQGHPAQDELAPDSGGHPDMTAMIKAERLARKKQKGTGRAPGPATLLFGRPEFVDDDSILVSQKQALGGSVDLHDIVRDLRQEKARQTAEQDKPFEKLPTPPQEDDDDWDDDDDGDDEEEASDELAETGAAAAGQPLDFFAEAEERFRRRQLELQKKALREDEEEIEEDFEEEEDQEEYSTPSYAPPDSYKYDHLEEDSDFIEPPPSCGLPSEPPAMPMTEAAPPLMNQYAQQQVDGTPVIRIPKGGFAASEPKVEEKPAVDPESILMKMPKILGSSGIVMPGAQQTENAGEEEPAAKPALPDPSSAAQNFLAADAPAAGKPYRRRSSSKLSRPVGNSLSSLPQTEDKSVPPETVPDTQEKPREAPADNPQAKPTAEPMPVLQSAFTVMHRSVKEPYISCLLSEAPGQRAFNDRYGRRVEAEYSGASKLPDKLKITSADGKYANALFRQQDGTLAAYRQDAERRLTHSAKLDPESGTIAVRDYLNNSIRSHSARGVSSEYVISEEGIRQTDIFPANPHKERTIIGVVAVTSAPGILLRKEESFSDGSKTAWVYEPSASAANSSRILKSCITTFSNGDRLTEEFAFDAAHKRLHCLKATFEQAQTGKVTEAKFSRQRRLVDFRMIDPAGFSVEIFPTAGTCRGRRLDNQQRIVDDVVLYGRDLLFRVHSNPSLSRFEPVALYDPNREAPFYEPQEPERLPDLGAYRLVNAITNQKLTIFQSGRIDVLEADGTLKWDGGSGELSLQMAGGEVLVNHSDGSAVKLHRRLTIEVKDGSPGSTFAKESLSTPEQDYLSKHQGKVDLRDFAEVCRRFKARPDRIEGLLKQLDGLDYTRQILKAEQIEILRKLLLHHIAYPAEISQGHANTAAACAVEKDFAIENPARYVAVVREALTGQMIIAGGGRLHVNSQNLLEEDMSGRDSASRIFQTAIMRVMYSPAFDFENTTSGIGRDTGRRPLTELTIDSLSEAVYKIGGGEMAAVELESTDDILYAFHAGHERDMILLVDAAYPPFSRAVGARQPHFVNLIGLLEGKPMKALVTNHFGLSTDHSRRTSGLDSGKLLENMRRAAGGTALALVHGGIHGRRYCVRLVADKCILKPVTRGADDVR